MSDDEAMAILQAATLTPVERALIQIKAERVGMSVERFLLIAGEPDEVAEAREQRIQAVRKRA